MKVIYNYKPFTKFMNSVKEILNTFQQILLIELWK